MLSSIFSISTFDKVLLTLVVIAFLAILNKMVLKPLAILNLYAKTPGSIVSYRIGNKVLKTRSNVSPANSELAKGHPFLSSPFYAHFVDYPDLRFIVMNNFHIPLIYLVDSELLTEYFKNQKNYNKFFPRSFFKKHHLRYSLGGSEGEEWKRQRKIISEAFHFENLKKIIPLIDDTVKEIINDFKPVEPEFMALQEFQKIAGENVGRMFFGENLNKYTINGRLLILEFAELFLENSILFYNPTYQVFGEWPLLWSSKFRKLRRDTAAFGEYAWVIMKNNIEKIKRGEMKNPDGRKSMLEILVERDKSEEILDERQLLGNFINFYFAGMDTTGHLLSMIFYLLTQNPHIKEKLEKSIDAVWDGKSSLAFEKLQQMEYLQAVIDETLRIATPAPSTWPRVAIVDHYIKDVPIKKGSMILPNFLKSNYNPNLYKDRGVFKPERWMKGSDCYERPADPYAFTPFSAGGRNCIGQHFSQLETKVVVCHFLKAFDIELKSDPNPNIVMRLLIEPEIPMKFKLTKKGAN